MKMLLRDENETNWLSNEATKYNNYHGIFTCRISFNSGNSSDLPFCQKFILFINRQRETM